MEMQRYGMREEGGFLLEAKRADRPIKNWPLLTPVTSPGKPLAHSHTCYNCLYRPEAGKRERERGNVKRKYMHVLFHTLLYIQRAKMGEGWTYFYTIKWKWKCNSREKREKDFNRLYSWDFPFPHVRLLFRYKSRQENSLTGVRTQIFLSVHVNGTVNVSITWIGPPTVISFFPLHTSVSQSHVYDVIFHTDSSVPVGWHHITVSASQCISLGENKAINEWQELTW